MELEIRIKGIPAMVRVHRAKHSAPDYSADNDIDYYGGWDVEYTICDSKGRPATWLENKLTRAEMDELEGEIIERVGIPECA